MGTPARFSSVDFDRQSKKLTPSRKIHAGHEFSCRPAARTEV